MLLQAYQALPNDNRTNKVIDQLITRPLNKVLFRRGYNSYKSLAHDSLEEKALLGHFVYLSGTVPSKHNKGDAIFRKACTPIDDLIKAYTDKNDPFNPRYYQTVWQLLVKPAMDQFEWENGM